MRKQKPLCFAAALALMLAAALPAWAGEQQAQEGKTWQVDWRDDILESRSEFSFGKFRQRTIYVAEAHVTLTTTTTTKLRVGNAILIAVDLGRATAGMPNEYVVDVDAPSGVKLIPIAPAVDIFPLSPEQKPRSGFTYVFGRPASTSIRLVLPAGEPGKAQTAALQWWAAEFTMPGEHTFKAVVMKNGRIVKQETITIPVDQGRGSWVARWEFRPFGVSLGAPGAQNSEQAREYLSRGIASAQVSFVATGDLRFEPAGTFLLPLDGTAVWTRLITANPGMPTGRAEMATMVSQKPVSTFMYTIGYQGSLLPEVTLSNLPAPPGGGSGPAPGPGGWRYWPAFPAAAAPIVVLGWVLGRRAVDVWLVPAEAGRILVRRGRRGPGRVRAVLTFATAEGGATATRELVLARNETQEVQAPEGWHAAELTVPGRRNRGQPTRLEREAV